MIAQRIVLHRYRIAFLDGAAVEVQAHTMLHALRQVKYSHQGRITAIHEVLEHEPQPAA